MPDPNVTATQPNAAPPDASATAPQIEQSSAPIPNQLQAPPAAQPQPQAVPALQPAAAPPVTQHSPNKLLMSFGARLLSAIAGDAPRTYSIDPNTQKLVANQAAPESSGQKVQRILGHALEGLSAPVDRNQASGAAKALSGFGAGAGAVRQQMTEADKAAQEKAKEDFERDQQAKLRHMEIGKQNALTTKMYFDNLKAANEMDPHFAQNQSLFNAVQASPDLNIHATEMTAEQVEAEEAKDHMFTQTHLLKPLGRAPQLGPDGQPVMITDASGNQIPASYMRIAVIDGTKDGKIAVTPEMAKDIAEYGGLARIPNASAIKAGDEYELGSLIPLMNKIDEQKSQVLQGWQHSTIGWTKGPKGEDVPVEINSVDKTRTRNFPAGVTPAAAREEKGKEDLQAAQTDEAKQKAKEAAANAAVALQALGGNMPTADQIPELMDAMKQLSPSAQSVLRTYKNPETQAKLLDIAYGEQPNNFPENPRPKSGVMSKSQADGIAKIINPDYTPATYDTILKYKKDFATKSGPAVDSFNQFLGHSAEALDVVKNFQTTNSPWLNTKLNVLRQQGMGDPQVSILVSALQPVRDEYLNLIKSGRAATKEEIEEANKALPDDATPNQLYGVLNNMAKQAVTRVDQINEDYKTNTGRNYPNLVNPGGRQAANALGVGDLVQKYQTGGRLRGVPQGPQSSQGGQNLPPVPQGMTRIQDSQGGFHDIPQNNLKAAQQRDPGLKVIQ